MTGNLTVVFFEAGQLKQQMHEGLNVAAAARVMVETIENYPNAQFTWDALN